MGVAKLLANLVRLTLMAGLLALVMLGGLLYFDVSGQVSSNVREAAASALGPGVVRTVEQGGATAAQGLGELLQPVLRGVEAMWASAAGGQSSAALAESAETTNAWSEAESREVLREINAYRRENGLDPLRWEDGLAAFAQQRADDMLGRGYFSHHDPATGKVLLTDLRRLVTVGENLYQVSGPAVQFMRQVSDNTVRGWQNSQSHNELMLMPGMRTGGVAIARTPTRIVAVLIVSG